MSDLRTRRTLFALDRTFFTLLKTHAFTDLNVSLICKTAHITRSTFYQYYLDLDDWLGRMVGRYTLEAQSLINCDDQAAAADLSALVAALKPDAEAVLALLAIHHPAGDLHKELADLFATRFTPLLAGEQVDYLAQLYAQAAVVSLTWQLEHPQAQTEQPLAAVVAAICAQ